MEPSGDDLRVDLREVSYDDWRALVFCHPVAPVEGKEWYFQGDLQVEAHPGRQVAFLSRLFLDPEVMAMRFTPDQIEQGFWFMFGPGGDIWFRDTLWDASVPWEARRRWIEALPELYDRLFDSSALDTISFMLPDLLAHEYGLGIRRPRTEEDRRVQDALFAAFRVMLNTCHATTEGAALHGLHHLAHPAGNQTIRAWLRSQRTLPDDVRQYAENVLAGKAQ